MAQDFHFYIDATKGNGHIQCIALSSYSINNSWFCYSGLPFWFFYPYVFSDQVQMGLEGFVRHQAEFPNLFTPLLTRQLKKLRTLPFETSENDSFFPFTKGTISPSCHKSQFTSKHIMSFMSSVNLLKSQGFAVSHSLIFPDVFCTLISEYGGSILLEPPTAHFWSNFIKSYILRLGIPKMDCLFLKRLRWALAFPSYAYWHIVLFFIHFLFNTAGECKARFTELLVSFQYNFLSRNVSLQNKF